MKMFLVRGKIEERRYMEDRPRFSEEFRIVMAENEDEARDKYYDYWEGKGSEYCVSYYAQTLGVTEALE